MPSKDKQFDCWYAAEHTKVVHAPAKALETFGATLVNYHLVAELEDDPRKVRIREGRLEAHRPSLITPEEYAQNELEGFGEEAKRYLDFLKQHEDKIRILQYGYSLKQESFSEQVVTDSIDNVLDRVVAQVKASEDSFGVVVKGVDEPWDVCLVKTFWLHVNASVPVNAMELECARVRNMAEMPSGDRGEVERAFALAEGNPSLVKELGMYLRSKGIFERYQDRFFKLVRRG